MRVRLQKFLADAGVASRRASEQVIVEGRVTVNGKTVQELGTKVDPDQDEVAVDGRPVRARRKLYIALNKPPGYISTRTDPLARKTVAELLPKEWGNLYTVGRLDRESEGLIFLTNDGDFSLRITHPRYGIRKKYLATVEGRVEPIHATEMTRGLLHEGERLKAEKARILRSNNSHSLVELELAEGKNREVRRLFDALGKTVIQLARVQIGRVRLGELPTGKWRALTPAEIKSLLSDGSEAPTRPRPTARPARRQH
jgi:23S rRNA pseudouridine2605 synthase